MVQEKKVPCPANHKGGGVECMFEERTEKDAGNSSGKGKGAQKGSGPARNRFPTVGRNQPS